MATANKIMLVSNRVELAKSYLLSQFKDRPNINALVDALVSELQELENVINDVQTVRTLEGSYGWWTDQIGNELDISRGNYADNDFKTAIKIAMSKQTASASVEDILRIVSLITGDTEAQLDNNYPYMLELYSWLFCVSDSADGLNSLAQLFPLNTRVRLVKHDILPFTLGVAGKGLGSGATLCSLVYHKNGHSEDPRFVTTPTQDIPPAITSAPTLGSNPYIYGGDLVGDTLTLSEGTYNGDSPLTITKQWLNNGLNISGATGNTYTLVAGDAGDNISCKVNVSNTYGSLIAYSNTIPVNVTVPPTNPFTSNLGVQDFTAIQANSTSSPITCTAQITIDQDGNIVYENTGLVDSTLPWSSSPTATVGNDYSFMYSVVTGNELVGLNQNAAVPLTSDRILSMSITSRYDKVKAGAYDFTIFKTSDSSIISTKRLYISVEIVNTAV